MKNNTLYSLLGAALVFSLTGCPGGDDDTTNATTSGDPSGDPSGTSGEPPGTTTNPTTGMVDPDTTNGPSTTMVDPSTTMVDPDTTNGPSTTNDPDTTGGDPGFVFPDDAFEDYIQIERHGAVEAGTAGIKAASGLGLNGEDIAVRDPYNASNPEEDAAMMWFGEIAESVTFFHDNLDDDIMMLGLMPASIMDTVNQAGPVILPDTIKWDPSAPTAYPNGRTLTDPVVDITLAAVLLKLGPNQPLSFFADLPLNPPENDVPFKGEFPFLAAPH